MEPQQEQAEATERAEERLEAALTDTTSSLMEVSPSLTVSEAQASKALLETLVLRVDQLAKVLDEQASRQERVNNETQATMQLAREMIVQTDVQYQKMLEVVDRMEVATEALVKVQANLSELIAALVGQQKG